MYKYFIHFELCAAVASDTILSYHKEIVLMSTQYDLPAIG